MCAAKKLRVFILEDHDDTRAFLRMHLEKQGHTVFTASSLAGATEAIRKSNFDVILSDIGLNDGLGWDFFRGLHFAKPVLAIAISGAGRKEDIDRSKLAGFNHHLTKPVDLSRLDELLSGSDSWRSTNATAKLIFE